MNILPANMRFDAGDDRGKRSGDGRVRGVGKVRLAADGVAMHAGVEGSVYHAGGSAEFDEGTCSVGLDDGESVANEP